MVELPVPLPWTWYLLLSLLAATPLLWAVLRVPPPRAGWRWDGWPTLVLGLGWGVLLGTGVLEWMRLLGYGTLSGFVLGVQKPDYLPIPLDVRPQDWLILVLFVPVAEELCLRGALLGGLLRAWSPLWAVFLSATTDVVLHAEQPWIFVRFLVAVGYALAFLTSGSVLTAMLAHSLAAGAMLLAKRYPGAVFALPSAVLLTAAIVSLLFILLGWRARQRLGVD